MSRRKILFVSPSLVGSGTERLVWLILQYLNRKKFEPLLAVFRAQFDYPVPEDVPVICFHKKGAHAIPELIWRLARVYEKERPDTVISFVEHTNLIAVFAKKVSHVKPRLLLTAYNHLSIDLKQALLARVEGWLIPYFYPQADAVICLSRGVANDLEAEFRIPRQKIRVIYGAVDTEYVSHLTGEKVDHPFFTPKEIPVIVAIGRLVEPKGYPYLLRAFAKVMAEIPCRLIIIGEGRDRKSLEKLVQQVGIERQVEFLGFQKNPFKYLARSDIFVLSSLWEGFALVIMEAMACGVPVIATRCPSGPEEIITDGVNGLLVPVADETALAKAMLRLLNDKHLATRLAQAGRKRVEAFDVAKYVKEYEALF